MLYFCSSYRTSFYCFCCCLLAVYKFSILVNICSIRYCNFAFFCFKAAFSAFNASNSFEDAPAAAPPAPPLLLSLTIAVRISCNLSKNSDSTFSTSALVASYVAPTSNAAMRFSNSTKEESYF